MIRDIVRIDEEKCDGCGLCVPACAEGAIRIVDGKARLEADNLCDGLGACLGECPQGAILIERRAADAFDERVVVAHLGDNPAHVRPQPASGSGCPGSALREIAPPAADSSAARRASELRQWPVQLHLVPPTAPFLQGADLVVVADCVPFAYADVHRDFIRGRVVVIGCPKLDDGHAYLAKLTEIFRHNTLSGLTVVHMEVPCCRGLITLVRQALAQSGAEVALQTVMIGIDGKRH
jgi:Fe-S-cluster-containing hydrogenase component 2